MLCAAYASGNLVDGWKAYGANETVKLPFGGYIGEPEPSFCSNEVDHAVLMTGYDLTVRLLFLQMLALGTFGSQHKGLTSFSCAGRRAVPNFQEQLGDQTRTEGLLLGQAQPSRLGRLP